MSDNNLIKRLRSVLGGLAANRKDARLGAELDDAGIAHASTGWKPKDLKQRIEIMVTGDPSRVGAVADTINQLQKEVFGDASKPSKTEMRITGFLDGCIHRSKWSKKSFKAAEQARQWHCEQSKTRFADAFAKSSGEMVDTIILIGHRFDDDMSEAIKQAKPLKDQGVKIHCFHTGDDAASKAAYEKLASETDGVFMQLPGQDSLGEVMPILMAHIEGGEALTALTPASETARLLQRLLTPETASPATFLAEDEAVAYPEDDDPIDD